MEKKWKSPISDEVLFLLLESSKKRIQWKSREEYVQRGKFDVGKTAGVLFAALKAEKVQLRNLAEKPYNELLADTFNRDHLLLVFNGCEGNASGDAVFGGAYWNALEDPAFCQGFIDGLLKVWKNARGSLKK